jgi:hypothetical protein
VTPRRRQPEAGRTSHPSDSRISSQLTRYPSLSRNNLQNRRWSPAPILPALQKPEIHSYHPSSHYPDLTPPYHPVLPHVPCLHSASHLILISTSPSSFAPHQDDCGQCSHPSGSPHVVAICAPRSLGRAERHGQAHYHPSRRDGGQLRRLHKYHRPGERRCRRGLWVSPARVLLALRPPGPPSQSSLTICSTSLWHVDCFRCAKCKDRVSADTNLLLLSDGSPVCGNCSYQVWPLVHA